MNKTIVIAIETKLFSNQIQYQVSVTLTYCFCVQVHEKNPSSVKNFGVWLRYDSRSGTHNMYREYRDTRVCGAVEQCCK